MNAVTKTVTGDINMKQHYHHHDSQGIPMSEDAYLATEPNADVRREYIDGKAYAMAGATYNHHLLAGNLFGEFRQHLKGNPCTAFKSDMKVSLKMSIGNNYVYPDVVVDCDKTGENVYVVTNPLLIVEVLSGTTRKLDQTTKRLGYINLPSLLEYVMVEQDIALITIMRKSSGWQAVNYYLGDPVTFEAIGLTLSVEEIYDHVANQDMNDYLARKQRLEEDRATGATVMLMEPLTSADFVDGIIKG